MFMMMIMFMLTVMPVGRVVVAAMMLVVARVAGAMRGFVMMCHN